MKFNKKIIAIPAIALAAGLGLAACSGGSGGSGQYYTNGYNYG
jgi:ABC-type glycerol-3-phosphate transport system substrate-binding protein